MVKLVDEEVNNCSIIKDGKGRLIVGEGECKGFGRITLRICIICNSMLQSPCVALVVFGEVITSEEGRLGGMKWK